MLLSEDTMEEEKEQSVEAEKGTERTTACKHEWVFVGMNGTMYDYQCVKCWSGMQREEKL